MPEDPATEFESTVSAEGLEMILESRSGGPYSGVEWLMPTAVVLLITRKYFDSFLSEMGKDHYHLLKRAIKTLAKRTLGAGSPVVTLVGTPGKLDTSRRFSPTFSIEAEGRERLRIKLLVEPDLSDKQRDEAISAFLDFLDQYHAGTLEPGIADALSEARIFSGTLLLAYDQMKGVLEVVDPLPQTRRRP